LSIFREGYDPKYPEDDRFITLNTLKNDLGESFSLDLGWSGKRGTFRSLEEEDRRDLEAIRSANKSEDDDAF
jgi:hypothetical protein